MTKIEALLQKIETLFEQTQYEKAVALLSDKALDGHKSADLYLWRALIHKINNNLPDARIHADKALLVEPDMATRLFEEGNNLYFRGEYNKAIVCYDKAILLKPDFTDAFVNKGLSLYHTGEYDNAIVNFNIALEYAPQQGQCMVSPP